MKMTAKELKELGIIERVIPEPEPADPETLPEIAKTMEDAMEEFFETWTPLGREDVSRTPLREIPEVLGGRMEKTNILKPLKIGNLVAKRPVIQGGMGVGISLSSLAGAVAKAGGIGIISTAQIGFKDHDFGKNPMAANLRAIHSELKKAREKAPQGVLGFNIMVATKEYASYVKEAVKAGADVIISGAGLPIDMPKYVAEAESEADGGEKKERRTMIAPIVSSVKSALVICRMWDRKYHTAPDFVVVEGPCAGGHLGFSREQLTELGADTDHVAETYDEPAYDKEVRGIIETVKELCREV